MLLARIIQARAMAFYAVAKGRNVGVYETWAKCEQQVKGFKGAKYKKFNTRTEAEKFIALGGSASCASTSIHTAGLFETRDCEKDADFWPENVDDSSEITEEDLMQALNEVEGNPTQSTSRKRKQDTSNVKNSKLPRHDSILEVVSHKRIGAFDFPINADGYVLVYTDGSCIGNGRSNPCAGFGVYFAENHKLNVAKPVNGRVTNNVGEIQAAIHAIKIALDLGISKLCINTDSQFLIKSITMWVKGWKKRNWHLANNEPVKNVDDFKELDELLEKNDIKVFWNYVAGHKGIIGNEMADKLAREGAELHRQRNLNK